MAEDFTSLYEANKDLLCKEACSSVSYARENALVELESTGMPNSRVEYWKYSRIGKVLNGLKVNTSDGNSTSEEFSAYKESTIEICSIQDAIQTNNPLIEEHLTKYAGLKNASLTALNTAFFYDGVFIHIPDDTEVKNPITLPTLKDGIDGSIMHPRNLIIVGKNSSATIISENGSTVQSGSLTNSVEEIVVGENSNLKHYILQNGGVNEVNSIYVSQERNSSYTRVTTTLKGEFIRNNINVCMEGPGCEANLYGYYHINGKCQVDNHTIIEHKEPDCLSNELYVGLLDDDASGIFNGRVWVHQDAQRTNAFQSNKNILLSDNATMNTKPELEIYADDVKCSHGATIGQVNPEALFYLRSRGIPKKTAMSMLLQGFSIEVTDKIEDASFRDKVVALILDKLSLT